LTVTVLVTDLLFVFRLTPPPLTTGPQGVPLLFAAAAWIAPRSVQAPLSPVGVTVIAEAAEPRQKKTITATATEIGRRAFWKRTSSDLISARWLVNGFPIVARAGSVVKRE